MAEQGIENEVASFARGMGSPLGLFTEPIKTFVDEATFEAWLRLCNEKSTTSSEMLRDVVYLLTHGKTPAELTAEDRRALLAGKGPTAVLDRIGKQA
jgi:hypothetical protein